MPDIRFLLLSTTGRLDRQGFWITGGALLVAGLLTAALPVVGPVAGLLLLWSWTCVSAKRLHDMGRPAGWVAVPAVPAVLVGVLGLITALMPVSPATTGAMLTAAALAVSLGGLAMLVGLAFLAWLGLTSGVPGANRYGEPASPLLAG